MISIFKNFFKFSDKEFISFYSNTVLNFLEANDSKENIIFREKVFFTIIDEMAGNLIVDKFYVNLLKSYVKKYVLVYDKENALSPTDAPINKAKLNKDDYDNFLNKIKEINLICKINNENNFMTDLIVYLVKTLYDEIFPSNINSNNSNNEDKTINAHHAIFNNQISPNNNNSALSKIIFHKINYFF